MYKPEHFTAQELVPPEEYRRWGEGAIMMINPLLCITLDTLRERHGRLVVNSTGRDRQQSGLRTVEFYRREYRKLSRSQQDKKYTASRSAHIRGDAADCIPLDTTLDKIHADIKANPNLYPFLHFVETDITWLHVDVRNQPDITFWSPKRGVTDVVKQAPVDWAKLVQLP